MANDNAKNIERAWELMKKIGFAMLVTRDGDKLRARPMSAFLERENNAIYFLTDARRHKDDEIAQHPGINLSFADSGSQKYVSLTGTAVVSNDRAKIKQLFTTPAKAWWDSAEDPNIRVLKVTPDDAEFWDSPGTVISYVKMAAAAVTGTRPEIGDNRKVAMSALVVHRRARNARKAGPRGAGPGRDVVATARSAADGVRALDVGDEAAVRDCVRACAPA